VRRKTRGQATVFLVMMLPLFLAVGGLALDAGHAFVERAHLQSIADAAARAGAIQIDEAGLYNRGDGVVRLEPTAAREAAMYYAMYNGMLAEDVQADAASVYVRIAQDVPTVFLRVVRVNSIQIHAEATARPRYGIDRADG
jgi:Putative Flp pilus-assembly TadE/G-like